MANANIAMNQGADSHRYGDAAGRGVDTQWDDELAVFANAGARDYVGIFDDFLGDAIDARWDEDLATGATIAVQAAANGTIRFSTDDTDDDHATLALGLHWLVSKGYTVFEARLTNVSAITLRAVEIGLSDAVSETGGLAFSSHDATPVGEADDAAIFAINSDESVATWSLLSVNGGGTPQRSDSEVAPVAGTWQGFRIVIDSAGEARFYIDEDGDGEWALVGTHTLAVATTALLTPWISLKSLSGAIKSIDVDYVSVYGKR